MKFLCVVLASMTFVCCAHSRWSAQEAPLGETKSMVVETLGSPERSWRKDGHDYWYYNASSIDPQDKVILVFDEGRLIQKLRPGSSPEFNQLEAELIQLKPENSGEFETLE